MAAQQDLDDGAYHEEDEQAASLRVRVQDIVAVEWATCHTLSLGSNDYTPALLLHVMQSASGDRTLHVTSKHCMWIATAGRH